MLEHVPAWLGEMLRGRRAGHRKLVAADTDILSGTEAMTLTSPAFSHGGRLPIRFTADGAGVSPPLSWSPVPDATRCLVLIVEDPDAPFANPLVHAIVWNIPQDKSGLAEGAIIADGAGGEGGDVGRNSLLSEGWLPPDPPNGHGEHDYVFQLFALDRITELGDSPGRRSVVEAIAGHVLALGVLIGTYSRGEPSSLAPAGAGAASGLIAG